MERLERVTTTVFASGVAIDLTTLKLLLRADLESAAETFSKLNFTSAEVMVLPEWNFTPLRNVKV